MSPVAEQARLKANTPIVEILDKKLIVDKPIQNQTHPDNLIQELTFEGAGIVTIDPTESNGVQDPVINTAFKTHEVSHKESNLEYFNRTGAVFGN